MKTLKPLFSHANFLCTRHVILWIFELIFFLEQKFLRIFRRIFKWQPWPTNVLFYSKHTLKDQVPKITIAYELFRKPYNCNVKLALCVWVIRNNVRTGTPSYFLVFKQLCVSNWKILITCAKNIREFMLGYKHVCVFQ